MITKDTVRNVVVPSKEVPETVLMISLADYKRLRSEANVRTKSAIERSRHDLDRVRHLRFHVPRGRTSFRS